MKEDNERHVEAIIWYEELHWPLQTPRFGIVNKVHDRWHWRPYELEE